MPFDLTDRQIKLLEAIISEYLESSSPVGSQTIVDRYKLQCSAATIRNEMADLMDRGFLLMSHTSSGRKPSPLAYRFFVEELLEEQEVPVLQEVAVKQRLWPIRFETEKMLRQATIALADATHEPAYAVTSDGYSAFAGAANLLDNAEFWDINTAKTALNIIDRQDMLMEMLSKSAYGTRDIQILMGDEVGMKGLDESAFVFAKYTLRDRIGFVGIFGPSRINYSSVIPTVKYIKSLIEELSGGW